MGRGFLGFGQDLGGNYSYKPPGASYTVQGPQKQPEIQRNLFHITPFIVCLTKTVACVSDWGVGGGGTKNLV